MTTMTADLSFPSALSAYYSVLWRVTTGMFQEQGMAGGLTQAFLEYVMPALIVVLLAVVLTSLRQNPGASRTA